MQSKFASPGIAVGGFLIPPGATEPEIQLTVFSSLPEPHIALSATATKHQHVVVTVALLRPDARNRVVLNSMDVNGPPSVVPEVPEFFTESLTPPDTHRIAWGIHQVRSIIKNSGK